MTAWWSPVRMSADSAMKCTPQKTMYVGLGAPLGEHREPVRVAPGVGPADHLVALVVVPEDEQPVAERRLGVSDPTGQVVRGRGGVALRERGLEPQHRCQDLRRGRTPVCGRWGQPGRLTHGDVVPGVDMQPVFRAGFAQNSTAPAIHFHDSNPNALVTRSQNLTGWSVRVDGGPPGSGPGERGFRVGARRSIRGRVGPAGLVVAVAAAWAAVAPLGGPRSQAPRRPPPRPRRSRSRPPPGWRWATGVTVDRVRRFPAVGAPAPPRWPCAPRRRSSDLAPEIALQAPRACTWPDRPPTPATAASPLQVPVTTARAPLVFVAALGERRLVRGLPTGGHRTDRGGAVRGRHGRPDAQPPTSTPAHRCGSRRSSPARCRSTAAADVRGVRPGRPGATGRPAGGGRVRRAAGGGAGRRGRGRHHASCPTTAASSGSATSTGRCRSGAAAVRVRTGE